MNCSPVRPEATVNFIGHDEEMISRQLKRMYDAEFTESLSSSKQAQCLLKITVLSRSLKVLHVW